MQAAAHSSDESTSQPVSPSSICTTMPPTRPATVGRAFQSASVTVSPKPSRIDFWITAAECTWKALTSTEPTLLRFERMKMSRIAGRVARRCGCSTPSPPGSSCAIEPTSASCTSGKLLLHAPVGVDHAERVLPRVEARDLGEQRPLDVDPELVDDVGGVLGRERHVLRRQRVDRRRPDDAVGSSACLAARTRACGRSPRRSARATAAGSRARPGSASRGRCGSARSSARRELGKCSIIAAGCGSWTITKS